METLRRRTKLNHKEHSQICAINRLERKRPKTPILCPVCSLTIRGKNEFEKHYGEEMKMTSIRDLDQQIKTKTIFKKKNSIAEDEEGSSEKILLEDREEALQNIKRRKYSRYSNMYIMSLSNQKLIDKSHTENMNKEATEDALQETTHIDEEYISCVVCNEFLNPSNDCTLNHLSKCLSRKKREFDIFVSSDDDENDEVVEEFSWAGQTWIRTSSLIDSEFLRREGKLMRLEMDDGDEELDVDGDTLDDNFGITQFSDADVISCSSSSLSNKNQKSLLSKADEILPASDNNTSTEEFLSFDQLEKNAGTNSEKLIELLKSEIRKLGTHLDNVSKCSICVGPYNNPLVSTSCWHVCCTDCWLRSLGAKKMCPICGSIVSPSHLRKIFL